ncbi:MAG: fluoride efflux transporter CrcB [Candidatus Omnitrophica bacterium]|nr:fluoride efflux transporter CrcB [Candidatus Omnitrophota bacterium]
MLRLFYIAFGGAAGSLLRYWASGLAHRIGGSSFPWGTLSVNLIGSFLIGFLWGMFESVIVPRNTRILIFIGLLGSFTTFSTFTLESFNLIRDGEYGLFLANIVSSFTLGIALVFAGYFLSRFLFNIAR